MKHGSHLARALEVAANFAYLNALFIITSLPILTIGPAWIAMMGVVRKWIKDEEPPITSTYFNIFKEYFKKAISISCVYLVVFTILIGDFVVLMRLPPMWKLIVVPLFLVILVILISMTTYLYPLILNYKMTVKQLIRNAFYLSISRPIAVMAVVMFAVLLFVLSEIFRFIPFLCAFSVFTYIHYRVTYSSVIKVERILNT
ncbi:YesL family protein [Lederbergia ruris]|uniref:YesL family protein n=1 Tax=Lederbergia ruris TaxID=217495 RepID=UPI00399F3A20